MKILSDSTLSGHHKIYMNELLKIEETLKFIGDHDNSTKKNFFRYVKNRVKYIKESLNFGGKKDKKIVHFLYLDYFYLVGAIALPMLLHRKNKNVILIGTIHHVPQNKLKIRALKAISKNMLIIVHSDYLLDKLKSYEIDNIKCINYPYFPLSDQKIIHPQKLLFNNKNKIVFSLLGGTRKDKGLIYFLESLKYWDKEMLDKSFILIAGNEDFYTKEFIMSYLKMFEIEYHLDLKFIEEADYQMYLNESDAIVLPYSKLFSGNSGPMTEGVHHNIPIIGPRHTNIGEIIEKNNLGFTFEVENPESLAASIKKFLKNGWSPNLHSKEFKSSTDVGKFYLEHDELYKKLLRS